MNKASILDFNIEEVLRLSSIKRWGIIEMSRDQSVAEHSYNVAAISMMIANSIPNLSYEFIASLLKTAMVHDLPELITGDVPTTMKAYVDMDAVEKQLAPKYVQYMADVDVLDKNIRAITKTADYIEAIQFAEKFCVDSRKQGIIRDMHRNLSEFLAKKEHVLVAQAVETLSF